MTDKELEELLSGGRETQSLEVKGRMNWSCSSLAKDILALANWRDGGKIVIGIEDQTFARQGVDPATRDTYQVETMRDQLARYADPHVDIKLSFPFDASGEQYVVIEVASFKEIPVICCKDGPDTRAGTIYYRNSNRRVESAAVSNSYDMRDIITVAVSRMRERLRSAGLGPISRGASVTEKLDQELDGL